MWKGGTVGGLLWHVRIDLTAKLALAARDEKHAAPSHACSDVSETLTIDTVTITSGCPLSDPGAKALTAKLQSELPSD